MEMLRAELATVVPGADRPHAGAAGSPDAEPHRRLDARSIRAVEHDLEHAVDAFGHLGGGDSSERGTERVVRGGDHALVALRAHFAPAPPHAAGEREDDAGLVRHRFHGGLGRLEPMIRVFREDEKIPAPYPLLRPDWLLDQEFPLHDGYPPVALSADHLTRLESVAKHAQRLS